MPPKHLPDLSALAVNALDSPVFVKDEQHRWAFANDAACRAVGRARQDIIGQTDHGLFPKETADALRVEDEELLRSGESITSERYVTKPDGRRQVLVDKSLLTDPASGRRFIVGIAHDLTDQQRREREQFSERLAALHEVTIALSGSESLDEMCHHAVKLGRGKLGFERLGLWLLTGDGLDVRGSFGIAEDGELRDERDKAGPVDPLSPMGQVLAQRTRLAVLEDVELRDADGGIPGRGMMVIASLWDGEHVVGCLCSDNLLTQQPISKHQCELLSLYASALGHLCSSKQTAEALRQSEEGLRSVLDVSSDLIYKLNLSTQTYDYISPSCTRLLGYTPAEAKAMGLSGVRKLFHPDDHVTFDRCFEQLVRHAETGRPAPRIEYRCKHKNGAYRWHSASQALIRDATGRPVAIVGSVRDTTERKQAEEALRRSEAAYRNLVDNALLGVFRTSLDGRILYANNAVALMFDFDSPEEMMEIPVQEFYRVRGDRDELIEQLHHEDQTYRELEVVTRTGRPKHVLLSARMVDGCLSGIILDITERKQLEEQLRHAAKMEAIGQLAGGIAHDFNNLLTGILGYANALRLETEPETEVHKAALTIEKAAERAAELTGRLLGFARRGKHQLVPVDLHQTVHEVVALLGRTIDKNIRIVLDLDAEFALVLGDPAQLQQVFLNLAVNARDAMPEGGELLFRSTVDSPGPRRRPTAADDSTGRAIRIEVTDSGSGMPPDTLHRVFEPFFTTKRRGAGTGMGLAMVYGIVENHQGTIQVESKVGRGTTFSVELPLATETHAQATTSALLKPVAGSGRVLVIDDEKVVRTVAEAILCEMGYDVVCVASGAEGVEYYRRHAAQVDLVLLDMVMPEMGGRECFRRLRQIDPKVRALLSTGFGRNEKAQEILNDGVRGFVQKPYTVRELSQAVAKAINS